ncbi:ATP-binding cassette, sub-family b (mdr/tap), member 8 [Plakobranchus ocellatus]|uniref:ATP-binding cassette, sub-family b (Mdr/tap), member 8 n=1 Tax=Plakobranchus ocellatus TaxID=259542 RepID=A0AAV4DBY1_9GAST|nr:ATP-binding cassette, sub-family b (mdr/tap), member 8 [Plakobranchus ocellatus]
MDSKEYFNEQEEETTLLFLLLSRSSQSRRLCFSSLHYTSQRISTRAFTPLKARHSLQQSICWFKEAFQAQLVRHKQKLLQFNLHRTTAFLSIGASGLVVGSGLSLLEFKELFPIAHCASSKPNRISHNDDNHQTDPDFQWRLLLELLWHDIFFLIGAIVAAIGAALVNIQIPLMLGKLTDIVNMFNSEVVDRQSMVADFLSEIKRPALKLLGLYGLQSFLTFSYISFLAEVGENLAERLRKRLFKALLEQDIEFFDQHKTGILVDRYSEHYVQFWLDRFHKLRLLNMDFKMFLLLKYLSNCITCGMFVLL